MDSLLSRLNSPYGDFVLDEASGSYVYHVTNSHLLMQAAGYLKHTLAKTAQCVVAFRGQVELFDSLTPTLYRELTTQSSKETADKAIGDYLARIADDKAVLRAVGPDVREPLLQHYGVRTRWLDLVDNIWVALWFGCYKARCSGPTAQFLHFEQRAVRSNKEFVYVVMLNVPASTQKRERPGFWSGGDTELVDLRVAAPSHFVRPHAQHGLLVRRARHNDHTRMDYSDLIVGVIRVSLFDALLWLGSGGLTSVHSLFPPATYDYGYGELLLRAPAGAAAVGAIQQVGA
ncbi:MAG: FRG domain-containing protein [Planctomycetota bacterium]